MSGWIISRSDWKARHADGRPSTQVDAAVRHRSKAACADALGVSVGHIDTYMSGVSPTVEAELDKHPPGTVLLHPNHPGGTVMGQKGWVVADPPPAPRVPGPPRRSRYSRPEPLAPARPAQAPVKPWREIADALASRLRHHARCPEHPPAEASADCPFCADRDAYDLYLQAGGTVGPPNYGEGATAIPIHEIPFNH